MAPVYDLVTTSVYLPHDGLALTLNGSTRWPTSEKVTAYGRAHGEFTEIGQRIVREWESGVSASLRG